MNGGPWLIGAGLLAGIFLGAVACRKQRQLGPQRAVVVEADGALRIRAMTFNVRYENPGDGGERAWRCRLLPVVRMIRSERPDVIGIQEAVHGQVADLWASLPDYEFIGSGRDDGGRAGEYTGIFYVRARFEPDPQEGGVFWLSDTPERAGSATWGNTIPRMVTWRRFTDRASGRAFTLYNTHWDHRHQGSRDEAARLIRRHIALRGQASGPVILLGDFNAIESNPALRFLTTGGDGFPLRLVDTFEAVHPDERRRTTLHFWKNTRMGALKVDHILVSEGVKILDAKIRDGDNPMVSDHFPVLAEFEFPKH